MLNAYEFSPRVSTYEGRELKWENGSYRHYVLFQEVLSSFGRCPEDPEYYEKTFYYTSIPLDIDLQKAFLIWTSFQLPSQINEPTDSSVTLNFYGEGKSYKLTQVVEASDSYLISEPQGFEFDSLVSPEDPSRSYFTYRVDITEFIDEILGRRPENGAHSGSFYLEDLNCNYVPDIYPKGTEVGSWAIIMIYEEPESPRNSIYIYDGLSELEKGIYDLNTENLNCGRSENDSCILITDSAAADITETENDWMISNLLIKSFVPEEPDFDIPSKKELVLCSPTNEQNDKWCEGGFEHNFSIRIKNTGTVPAKQVNLSVDLPPELEYVPGSAKYADDLYSINGRPIANYWNSIPDLENDRFPLSSKYRISYILNPSETTEIENMILVNFRAKIVDEADVRDFKVKAAISSGDDTIYKTVHLAELNIEPADRSGCIEYMEEIDLIECGEKTHINHCIEDYHCHDGQYCCLLKYKTYGFCSNVQCGTPVPMCGSSFDVKKYNQYYYDTYEKDNEYINYVTLQDNLILFDLILETPYSCALADQAYELRFETSDSNISLENARMYQNSINSYSFEPDKDIIVDEAEMSDDLIRFYYPFLFKMEDSYARSRYYFVADINYKKDKVAKNASFSVSIDDSGMIFNKQAPLEVKGLPVVSNFHIGHSGSVIFTNSDKGYHYYELTIKTTSIDKDNKITAIYAKVSDKSGLNMSDRSLSFTLYTDDDSDGRGDTIIATANKAKDGLYKLETDISLHDSKWKTLILISNINLNDGESIIIEVPEIELEHESDILGLPIESRENYYWEDDDAHQLQCGCSLTVLN